MYTQQFLQYETPSIKEGLSHVGENHIREETASFIFDCGIRLCLGQPCIACACTLMHEFYCVFSFQKYNRWFVGLACLLIASKSGEEPRRIRDILNCGYAVMHPEDPVLSLSSRFTELKGLICDYEMIVFRSVRFDFNQDFPYRYVLQFIHSLSKARLPHEKEESSLSCESAAYSVANMAWILINESLKTTICIKEPPEKIAAAALYEAVRNLQSEGQFRPPPSTWERLIGYSLTEVLEIAVKMQERVLNVKEQGEISKTDRDLIEQFSVFPS